MPLHLRLVRQNAVETAVQARVVDFAFVDLQQIVKRSRGIPTLLDGQFASRRAETIDRQQGRYARTERSRPAGLMLARFIGIANQVREAFLLRHPLQFFGIVAFPPIANHHVAEVGRYEFRTPCFHVGTGSGTPKAKDSQMPSERGSPRGTQQVNRLSPPLPVSSRPPLVPAQIESGRIPGRVYAPAAADWTCVCPSKMAPANLFASTPHFRPHLLNHPALIQNDLINSSRLSASGRSEPQHAPIALNIHNV